MRKPFAILLPAVTLLLLLQNSPVVGQPQELELIPSKDNTLYESLTGTVSNGVGQYLFFGRTNQGAVRRALMAFDVAASIPSGSVIESAVLRISVTMTIAGPSNATVRRVQQDWGQGTSNAGGQEGTGTDATAGDATWIHTFFDTDTWSTEGGDFDDTLTSASVGPAGEVDFPSSAAFVETVQSWLETPGENFGLIILGDENKVPSAKQIGSREAAEAIQPRLIVTYSVPVTTEKLELPNFLTSLSTYPNPTTDLTRISYELTDTRDVRIDLIDVTGRIVATSISGVLSAGAHMTEFDTRDLTPGLYFVRVLSTGQSATKTIVVR